MANGWVHFQDCEHHWNVIHYRRNNTNAKGCLIVDENGLTSREGVYAGGDAVTGAATVILAMGAGKTAAAAMDAYMQGK